MHQFVKDVMQSVSQLNASYNKNWKNRFNFEMIPDSFPVFNIQLEVDFESSDNTFPSYGGCVKQGKGKEEVGTMLAQQQNLTSFSTIGRRNDNLDRTLTLSTPHAKLLAIFDGHCDPKPVEYLQQHLLRTLAQHSQLLSDPHTALLEVFEHMERQVIKKFEKGSTAMVAIVLAQRIVVANLGDSKLFSVDESQKVHELTIPHNLNNQEQLMSVINRGGIILKKGNQYRINGELNLSRCFGDKHLKQFLSAKPDFYSFDKSNQKRLVFATDGFYNAPHLQRRLKLKSFQQLKEDGTVYQDNASAIYLDF